MDFRTSVDTACVKWLTFRGRASRSEYWWIVVWFFLVVLSIAMVFVIVSFFSSYAIQIRIIIVMPPIIFSLVALTSAGARRLHDCGISVWWWVGLVVVAALSGIHVAFAVGAIAAFLALIVVLLRKGTAGSNRYGPSPNAEDLGDGSMVPLPEVPQPHSDSDEERNLVRLMRIFIGNNSNIYTSFYHKYYGGEGAFRLFSWHWPAALVPLPWLWYRKMYLLGYMFAVFAYIFLILIWFCAFMLFTKTKLLNEITISKETHSIISLLVAYFALFFISGIFAKWIFIKHVLRRIRRGYRLFRPSEQLDAHLAKAGGVSLLGAVLGVFVMLYRPIIAFIAVIIASIAMMSQYIQDHLAGY